MGRYGMPPSQWGLAIMSRADKRQGSRQQRKERASATGFGPQNFDANFQEAVDFHLRGQLLEAERLYRKVLRAAPDHFDALHLLGVLEAQRGEPQAALDLLGKAIAINPEDAAAQSNLANVLLGLRRYEDALSHCDWSLKLQADHADAHNNRGVALRELGRFEDALESFDLALKYRPDFADALNNRSAVLRALGRYEDALESCDLALEYRPDFADALNNRSVVLRALGRYEDALESCDRALEHNPDFPDALYSRGNLLSLLKRYEEAAVPYEKLLAVAPDHRYAPGNVLFSKCYICDWSSNEAAERLLIKNVEERKLAAMPFGFLAFSDSPAKQLKCAQAHVESDHPPSSNPLWQGELYRHEKIRVAYVSSDFHVHPTVFLMLRLFEQHDRERFETIAISYGPNRPGPLRTRIEHAFDRFIDVRAKSALEIARLIRELEVDIAIDCKGFTQDSRPEIFAYRPAPIQAQYLGYPGTMGAEYIDYILADRFVIPDDHRKYYAENVVYLPDCYQVNDSDRHISLEIPDRREVGLPADGFVFCCFNQHFKITPQVFDVWARLLSDVDDSVLWLIEDNVPSARNLRSEAANRGIAPERLVFAQRTEQALHLARHRLADLFVDTLPYNAHTTASDALWAGLPVVTCKGNTFAGRVATSLLNAIGLPELVATDLDAYEKLALILATDPTMLSNIKAKLRQNRTTYPLFDTDRFRRHIEQAYIAMWERTQANKPPEGFSVPALD